MPSSTVSGPSHASLRNTPETQVNRGPSAFLLRRLLCATTRALRSNVHRQRCATAALQRSQHAVDVRSCAREFLICRLCARAPTPRDPCSDVVEASHAPHWAPTRRCLVCPREVTKSIVGAMHESSLGNAISFATRAIVSMVIAQVKSRFAISPATISTFSTHIESGAKAIRMASMHIAMCCTFNAMSAQPLRLISETWPVCSETIWIALEAIEIPLEAIGIPCKAYCQSAKTMASCVPLRRFRREVHSWEIPNIRKLDSVL